MINQAVADLASPTYRMRFFGGRSPKDVADEMPMLPVDAPGLPPVGMSLQSFARTLGDPAPGVVPAKGKSKAVKLGRAAGPWLTAVVRSALYQNGTTVPLEVYGERVSVPFMSGRHYQGTSHSIGPGPSRLVVVGKCLGRTEVEQQKPFCGPGSEPLWRAWREAGFPIVWGDVGVYLTNLLRFEPPAAAMGRVPKDWVMDGKHLLYQELVACRPEFVLVLGADALKALFGAKAKISDYKGRLVPLEIDCRASPDDPDDKFVCNVAVADHPAAVSRDPDLYPSLLSSVRFLAKHMGYAGELGAEVPTDYRAVLTYEELRVAVSESIRASAGGGYVAFDCEWEGSHPTDPDAYLYTVQWSHAPGHARVAYLRRCGGSENRSLPLERAVPVLKSLFEGAPERGARLVGHFAKADLPWLASIGVDLYDRFTAPLDDPDPDGTVGHFWDWQKTYLEGGFDTYIAAHCTDESQPKGLEVLTSTLLGMDRYDVVITNWVEGHCKEQKIRKSQLRGYGRVPEDLMTPSGCEGRSRRDALLSVGAPGVPPVRALPRPPPGRGANPSEPVVVGWNFDHINVRVTARFVSTIAICLQSVYGSEFHTVDTLNIYQI